MLIRTTIIQINKYLKIYSSILFYFVTYTSNTTCVRLLLKLNTWNAGSHLQKIYQICFWKNRNILPSFCPSLVQINPTIQI